MIFKTLATTDRVASLVTADYLKGSRLDAASEQSMFLTKAEQYHTVSLSAKAALITIKYDTLLEQMRVESTNLIHLSPAECRTAYSSLQMPPQFSNVLLISSSNASNTLDGFVDCELHYPEMIVSPKYQGVHKIDWFNTNGTASIFYGHKHCLDADFDFGTGNVWNVPVWDYYCTAISYPIKYCLAQMFEPECGVDIDIRVLVGIIVCLFVELVCLASLAQSRFQPFGKL